MTIPNLPNLSPNGVIQNPGIGQIIGQGLGNLAQFLQAKQQMEQQRQLAQQQLGQGQQRIDLEKAQQDFQRQQLIQAQAQQQAQQAEQQRQGLAVGDALQRMQSYQLPGMDMSPAGQIGGPSVQGYQTASTSVTPSTGDVLQGMQPQDASALLASSGYKSIIEQRQKDEEARRLGRKIININGTPVFEQGEDAGKAAGPAIPDKVENPKELQWGLAAIGKAINIDTSDRSKISQAQLDQAIKIGNIFHREGVANPNEAPDVAFGKLIVPEYMKIAQPLSDDSMSAKTELDNIRNAKKALDQGLYAGPGSSVQTRLGLIGAKILNDPELGRRADATNAYLQATASRIVPLPKGITRLTNAELTWLERMKGADPSQWGEAGIKSMLDAAQHAAEERINANNQKLERSLPGKLDPAYKDNLRQMYQVDLHGPDSYQDVFGKVGPGGTP